MVTTKKVVNFFDQISSALPDKILATPMDQDVSVKATKIITPDKRTYVVMGGGAFAKLCVFPCSYIYLLLSLAFLPSPFHFFYFLFPFPFPTPPLCFPPILW